MTIMNELRSQLEDLANRFIAGLLGAMSSGSLADLADQSAPKPAAPASARRRRAVASKVVSVPARSRAPGTKGRRKRSSAAAVEEQKTLALSLAKALKPGFSKGDIMKKSDGQVDLGRALSLLVGDGKLSKKGDRRSTRYWVK